MGTSLFSSSPFLQIVRNFHMASGKKLEQVSVIKQTLSSASDPKGIDRVNSGFLSGSSHTSQWMFARTVLLCAMLPRKINSDLLQSSFAVSGLLGLL